MARWATVAAVTTLDSDGAGATPEQHRSHIGRLLDMAGAHEADLVVLPECVLQFGLQHDTWRTDAPEIPNEAFEALAAYAAKHRFYLVIPTMRTHEGVMLNSAVLVGRDGKIIGAYDKMFPTIDEIEEGVRPGAEATVLETDFGRIGFSVCFDANFIEVFQGARENGAELMVFASVYRGGEHLPAWAFEFGFPIVACCPHYSCVVDMTGALLAETGLDLQPVKYGWVPGLALARVNLDRRLVHFDGHVSFEDVPEDNRLMRAKEKYRSGVSFDITAWRAAVCAMGSEMPDTSVDEIAREFGIEFYRDYLARARRVRQEALE